MVATFRSFLSPSSGKSEVGAVVRGLISETCGSGSMKGAWRKAVIGWLTQPCVPGAAAC